MAGGLPIYERPHIQVAEPAAQTEKNHTYPKIDETTVTDGSVREFED